MEVLQSRTFEDAEVMIKECECPDEKLRVSIDFMKEMLSVGKRPNFRDFWKMKKIALDLFKSEIGNIKRAFFWSEYTELLSEAHRLQKIFDEQMNDQVEQITLAISGLERDILENRKEETEIHDMREIDPSGFLNEIQKEIGFLQKMKQKALALREAVISQEMRIGEKNKLLLHLKEIKDQIFPPYKAKVKEMERQFILCAEQFISDHFQMETGSLKTRQFYYVKNQIKGFQGGLKKLSIMGQGYLNLSKQFNLCWEILEKESKAREEENKKREAAKPIKIEVAKEEVKDRLALHLEEVNALLKKAPKMEYMALLCEYKEKCEKMSEGKSGDKALLLELSDALLSLRGLIHKKYTKSEEGGSEPFDVASYKADLKAFSDELKKASNGCGLDIELAMNVKTWMTKNKERIECA